jgi:hypothetical protein
MGNYHGGNKMKSRREWLKEGLKETARRKKEQGGSLSRDIEIWEKRDRRGHIASVASIVCFCVPISLVLLGFLLCMYSATQAEGCSAGLAAVFGAIMVFIGGTFLAVVTSIIGTFLGLYAVLSTEWRRGKLGLFINLLLVLVCCACILVGLALF